MLVRKLTRYSVIIAAAALTATSLSASTPPGGRKSSSDPLSMIRRVSPGVRTAGTLPNKFRPKKVARVVPVHHAKVAVRRPKPISAVLPTAVEGPVPIGVSSVPLATAGTPLLAAPVAVAASSSSAFPFLVLPAALTTLTFGGGGTSIASAAPEPGTWLMMILGFGFLGSTLRRRRRAEREALLTALA